MEQRSEHYGRKMKGNFQLLRYGWEERLKRKTNKVLERDREKLTLVLTIQKGRETG